MGIHKETSIDLFVNLSTEHPCKNELADCV